MWWWTNSQHKSSIFNAITDELACALNAYAQSRGYVGTGSTLVTPKPNLEINDAQLVRTSLHIMAVASCLLQCMHVLHKSARAYHLSACHQHMLDRQ